MRSIVFKVAVLAFASFFLTLIGFAAQDAPAGEKEQPKAANNGKTAFEGACGGCHGLETAAESRYPKDGWTSVVQRMIERGADVKDADVVPLIDYLTATYGVKEAPPAAQ